MMVAPDRDQIRGDIERHLHKGEWAAARTALERLWTIHPSAALAAYVSAGFERLRGRFAFHRCRVAILRSFTLDPVIPLLRAAAWVNGIELTAELGEFNAFAQELHDPESWVYEFSPDVAILAVQTQDLAPALWDDSADLSETGLRETVRQVLEDFESWIHAFRSHSAGYLLLHTFEVPYPLNRGILDAQNAFGQAEAVREINSGLRRLAAGNRGVYVLDYDALTAAHGKLRWRDEHKWATVKMPVRAECMPALAGEWVRYLAPMCGRSCKVLVCDLDNTLWGGVVGESGIDGIQVDRDYPGAAYRKVQRALLDLKRRGIILAISSKNNREDAVEALCRHPGMLLRPEDFAAERINWSDKTQSLREIAAELNVGLDSLGFLDDNPVERERIKLELPEVTVLELPDDPMGFADVLRSHPALERVAVSTEDSERSRYYAERRSRETARGSARTVEEFYRSLEQEVEILPVSGATLARAAQLTQKTNQFNLTARRYREQQLSELQDMPGWDLYAVGVKDRFGDNGLVGVMLTRTAGGSCEIDTFLLSCRVISRTVETAMLAFLAAECRAREVQTLRGWFQPTAKNAPASDFYPRHGFQRADTAETGTLWSFDLGRATIECPAWIRLTTSRGTSLREYAIP
jgi:FkbH-like protein